MPTFDDQRFANLINALNDVMARQHRLEERVAQLERGHVPSEPSPTASEVEFQPAPTSTEEALPPPIFETPIEDEPEPVPMPVAAAVREPVAVAAPVEQPALETKVGLTILNRIGVVTLILGIAFFFKWAVDNDWIGQSGRVVLGLVAGFAALALADVLWRKGQQIFAQGITGTGVAITFLSFYAAYGFYHLISQPLAFALLLATTAMGAALALRYNAIAIAALGFLGAYLTPILLSKGVDHPWFLIVYLLVVNFAATELAKRRGWRSLELLSFAGTVLIYGSWLLNHADSERPTATVGLIAFCAQRFRTSWLWLFAAAQFLTALTMGAVWHHDASTFFPAAIFVAMGGLAFAHFRSYPLVAATAFAGLWLSVPIVSSELTPAIMPFAISAFLLFTAWSWWRSAVLKEAATVKSMTVFAMNGVAFYSVSYSVLHDEYHHLLGLLAVAVAASYLLFGMYLHRQSADRQTASRVVLLALGISVAFLALAVPIQLTGFTITIAWAIQAAALTWIGVRFKSLVTVFAAYAIFILAVAHLASVEVVIFWDPTTYVLLMNPRFFSFAALAAAFLLAAYFTTRLNRQLALIPYFAGHVTLLSGLSLEIMGWAGRSAAPENQLSVETIGITILFAIYAVMLVSIGVATRTAVNRLAGLILTAIVILKLYLFDVWQLERVYQIIAFVILGLLLLSTSFLYSRFKGMIDGLVRDLPKQEKNETAHP